MREVLLAGAEKVSINSAAVRTRTSSLRAPRLSQPVRRAGYGRERVRLSAAIRSGYEVVINGGRTPMGSMPWMGAARSEARAGEICLNSIDADGTQEGYETNLTSLISGKSGFR